MDFRDSDTDSDPGPDTLTITSQYFTAEDVATNTQSCIKKLEWNIDHYEGVMMEIYEKENQDRWTYELRDLHDKKRMAEKCLRALKQLMDGQTTFDETIELCLQNYFLCESDNEYDNENHYENNIDLSIDDI